MRMMGTLDVGSAQSAASAGKSTIAMAARSISGNMMIGLE